MFSKYYKAIIAAFAIAGNTLGTVAADPDIAGVLPTGWGAAVVTAGTFVGGVITFLVRNQKTIDQVDEAVEAGDFTLQDLESLVNHKAGKHEKPAAGN